jgi:tRNA-specific 2-thiouridylase
MDAQRVSALLGIKYFVWDFSERFKMEVVDDFIQEYEAGRTPNPCMRCNERIKFAALLEKALALGFDAVCTGHYATIEEHDGNLELHRSPATAKDQSYVLGVLTTDQLKHVLFPIGAESDKADIRKEAAERGLAVAQKPDSYDICFIPDGDTQGWLGEKLEEQPGQIVDRNGKVLSTHDGTHNFTVGQRKGLAIERPAKDGRPRYVLEIRPKTKTVVVGPQEALAIKELGGQKFTWCGQPPQNPELPFEAEVQVRAHAEPVKCIVQLENNELKAITHEPILGVAPGQTAVIYLGTRVLGQFTIDRTVSAVAPEEDE